MKKIIIGLVVLAGLVYLYLVIAVETKSRNFKETMKEQPDSIIINDSTYYLHKARLFSSHFEILDSIAGITAIDTLSNCQPSIHFMEENTGIEASTDANFFGRFACTKEDLANWHKWYEENCLKKRK